MCRISGILNSSLPVHQISNYVNAMCDCMRHGGPDDGGIFVDESASLVLGNRRLSLVDLSHAGHQPMNYAERYTITYNGEIYNYGEIRKELISRGHIFVSHTDTEVVLAAFAQWNVQAFEKFNGMFAFALWDKKEKELYLVRDAAGMKPLYYSGANNGLAFASEIRALKQIPFLQKENKNWPVYLLAYGHIPEPVTTLESVIPLRKGCFLKYNALKGISILQSFKHYSFTENTTGSIDVKEQLRNLMSASVERHLAADASIGVFLSGGLDSAIIASVASSLDKAEIQTLSLYFDEAAFSEKKYQDLLIHKIQSDSFQHLLLQSEFQHSFANIIDDMDMPCSDGINTWFISKYAKEQGMKAVLSGIGADELFGGYPSFSRIEFAKLLQHFPAFLNLKKKSNKKQLNRLAYLKMQGIKGIYLFLRGHFTPYETARQLDGNESEIWNILNDLPVMGDISNLSLRNQASWMEMNLYMQNQLLRDADVMGMIHSVEIRVPFLDNELIKFATGLNSEQKYKGAKRKQILIDSFQNILPREIWDRPKMGFSFPFAKWLAKNKYVSDLMSDGKKITQLNYHKFCEGDLHWSHMMSLILLKNKGIV